MNLSPIESSILDLAKRLLKVGTINIERLYTVSILHLKYPRNEIDQAIYQLFSKKILIKDTKITKDDLLKNDTRRKIFEYIIKTPGTYLREIRNKLNITPHQAAWHLQMLQKFRFIRKTRINKKIAYFEININPEYDKPIFLLRETRNLRILEKILLEPGISLNNLAKRVKIKALAIKYIVFYLQKLNLVYEIIEDNSPKYFGMIENIEPILEILKVPKVTILKYREIRSDFQKGIGLNNPIERIMRP